MSEGSSFVYQADRTQIFGSLDLGILDELIHPTDTKATLDCKLNVTRGAPVGTPRVLNPPVRVFSSFSHRQGRLCETALLAPTTRTFVCASILAETFHNLC